MLLLLVTLALVPVLDIESVYSPSILFQYFHSMYHRMDIARRLYQEAQSPA